MERKAIPLAPDGIYHIYNRANGLEQLFITEANYQFFLKQYEKYLGSFLDTFCYCLIPNHFHFLVRVRELDNIDLTGFQNLSGLAETTEADKITRVSTLISKQFSNFFNSYTKSFNKQQGRKGNLFMRPFKRKQVKDEKYLRKLIHYIHYNPIQAGLTENCNWTYSSYPGLLSTQKTKLARDAVIAYFEDVGNFKYCHQVPPEISGIEDW